MVDDAIKAETKDERRETRDKRQEKTYFTPTQAESAREQTTRFVWGRCGSARLDFKQRADEQRVDGEKMACDEAQ